MSRYVILPIGNPDIDDLKRLSFALSTVLASEVRLEKRPLDPSRAFIASRGQYNSTEILRIIDNLYRDRPTRVLGVTERDICIPVLSYVFGEAQLNGRAAVVSSHRLDPQRYGLPRDNGLFEHRILVESLHEIGHTFGLHHCQDWQCVMHTANDVDEIDIRGNMYCQDCSGYIL